MQNNIEMSTKENNNVKIPLQKKLLFFSLCLVSILLLSIAFISFNKSGSKDAFLLATTNISVTENSASFSMSNPDLEVDLAEYIQVSKGASYSLYEDSTLNNQLSSQIVKLKQTETLYVSVISSDKKNSNTYKLFLPKVREVFLYTGCSAGVIS